MPVLILWVFALVLFILAALNVAAGNPRFHLGWAGAACVALAFLLSRGMP